MSTTSTAISHPFGFHNHDHFSKQQCQNDATRPRHMTTYTFPAVSLLAAEDEGDTNLVLLAPDNASNRYEPKPLLPSPAVIANSGFEDEDNLAYFTMVPADEYKPRLGTMPFIEQPETEGFAGFRVTMDYRERHVGKTILQAVLFRQNGHGRTIFLRIKIAGLWYMARPSKRRHFFQSETWTFPLRDFGVVLYDALKPAWWYALDDLLQRRSDLAARHVAHYMRENNAVDITSPMWKQPREVDWASHLPKPTTLAEAVVCDICLLETSEMVTLPCGNGKHAFCSECLASWCKDNLPNVAGCPTCRRPVIGERLTDELIFGLAAGLYLQDDRYSEWENQQRADGDLDSRLAVDIKDKIGRGPRRMLECWDGLIATAKLEPASSTPPHLQMVHFKEFELVRPSLQRALESMPPGIEVEITALFTFLVGRVIADLDEEVERSEMNTFFYQRVLVRIYILRPTMEAFIRRAISRMLVLSY